MRRILVVAAVILVCATAPAVAASKVVVHGTLKKMQWPTATYRSSHGTFTAKWIGPKHYRLRGRIDGKRLTGTFRTRQNSSGTAYLARGRGRLGGRSVRISGGGPNDLTRTKLVLR